MPNNERYKVKLTFADGGTSFVFFPKWKEGKLYRVLLTTNEDLAKEFSKIETAQESGEFCKGYFQTLKEFEVLTLTK